MCKAQLNVLNMFDFYTVEFFEFIFLNFVVVFYQPKISIRNMMLKPESRDLTFFSLPNESCCVSRIFLRYRGATANHLANGNKSG